MTFEHVLALLGVIGAVLGFCATAIGSIGLWILNGMRQDLHRATAYMTTLIPREESQAARDRLQDDLVRRIEDADSRIDELFGLRTDPNLGGKGGPFPVRRRRSTD